MGTWNHSLHMDSEPLLINGSKSLLLEYLTTKLKVSQNSYLLSSCLTTNKVCRNILLRFFHVKLGCKNVPLIDFVCIFIWIKGVKVFNVYVSGEHVQNSNDMLIYAKWTLCYCLFFSLFRRSNLKMRLHLKFWLPFEVKNKMCASL